MTAARPAPPELDDLEFRPGDIVYRLRFPDKVPQPGIHYRVRESSRGWIGLERVRRDGGRDRREHGFSASPLWFALAERPEGVRYVRHGNVWRQEYTS